MIQNKKHFYNKLAAGILAAAMTVSGGITSLADVQIVAPGAVSSGQLVPSPVTGAVSGSQVQTAVIGQDGVSVVPVGNGVASGNMVPPVNVAPAQVSASVQSSDKDNVITAGSNRRAGVIASSDTLIVTEGEKNVASQDAILGGASLTLMGSSSGGQMLSMILQTKSGNLIVIDGGFDTDADRLRSQLKSMGGHVSAWLVTHPHKDHVGALNKLMQENANGITIDGIYCSLASPEWYSTYDPSGAEMAHTFISTLSKFPQSRVHAVGKGQTWQVDEVTIQVLNDRYELTNTDNHYTGNNAGIVYMLTVNGRRILVLGDMCYEGGEQLLQDVGIPALKADIVQMAHHGQQGVSEQFYQAVQPSVCLWPTPTWLWNADESQYATQTTKRWMNALGVQKHYVMKDGNQVIR